MQPLTVARRLAHHTPDSGGCVQESAATVRGCQRGEDQMSWYALTHGFLEPGERTNIWTPVG